MTGLCSTRSLIRALAPALAPALALLAVAATLAAGAGCKSAGSSTTSYLCAPACPAGFTCGESGCVANGSSTFDLAAGAQADLGGCGGGCSGATPLCRAGVCVACAVDDDCPAGQRCTQSGAITLCVAGCASDKRCEGTAGGADARCCGGACTDSSSDAANCGACGQACSAAHAASSCQGGRCVTGQCDTGWGDCNGDPADGCEANVLIDIANCGACKSTCTVAHGRPACSAGCYIAACDFGWADCNVQPGDGCEASVLSDQRNCGACGASCPAIPHGKPTCINAACQLGACDVGFADCDGNPQNGCEVAVGTDKTNCGACGAACGPMQVCVNGACTCQNCMIANAKTKCVNLQCTFDSCVQGYGDCNNDLKDGCETDLTVSGANCGACGMVCPQNLPHCVMGVCSLEPQYVGTFNCNDGPQWGGNPATYTCQEACAKVFGGNAGDYACSTQKGMIDHKANTSIWGVGGCQVAMEDYKKSVNYNCGAPNCAQSAYVTDNCIPGPNYCFK